MGREPDAETDRVRVVTDRRTFLEKAGVTIGIGIGAYVTGVPAALAASTFRASTSPANAGNVVTLLPGRVAPVASLNREIFAQSIRTQFVFRTPMGDQELTLVGTQDLLTGKPYRHPISECFALMFRGPANRPLEQESYPVRHGTIGTFDLFIVPKQLVGGRFQYYEAVFNRIATSAVSIP